jgi:hypothetical protein
MNSCFIISTVFKHLVTLAVFFSFNTIISRNWWIDISHCRKLLLIMFSTATHRYTSLALLLSQNVRQIQCHKTYVWCVCFVITFNLFVLFFFHRESNEPIIIFFHLHPLVHFVSLDSLENPIDVTICKFKCDATDKDCVNYLFFFIYSHFGNCRDPRERSFSI